MALIKCNDCGHDVSSDADACPNCGWKTPKARIAAGQDGLRSCGCGMSVLFTIPVCLAILFIMLGA